jgi:hypothetical protein
LEIDVKLDGQTIGVPGSATYGYRTFPVGADRWTAVGDVIVSGGGCSIGRGRASGLITAGAWLFLAALRRRRSRRDGG